MNISATAHEGPVAEKAYEMSNEQPRPDGLRESRYNVGDRVQIVYGREAGHGGVVIEVLPERWRVRYSVETTGGHRTFCEETDLALAPS